MDKNRIIARRDKELQDAQDQYNEQLDRIKHLRQRAYQIYQAQTRHAFWTAEEELSKSQPIIIKTKWGVLFG